MKTDLDSEGLLKIIGGKKKPLDFNTEDDYDDCKCGNALINKDEIFSDVCDECFKKFTESKTGDEHETEH